MKKIIIVCALAFLFANTAFAADTEQKLRLKLDKILLTYLGVTSEGHVSLEFDLYLARPDMGLQQPKNPKGSKLTVDLPKSLQPKYMYLSNVNDREKESGRMCDLPHFPHRCSAGLTPDEFMSGDHVYLVKVTFEDGSYAEQEITIPRVLLLEKPEILEPVSAPAQNDKFSIQFKNVGASEYKVQVQLCKPYRNDGVNPCLDSTDYYLVRKGKKLVAPKAMNPKQAVKVSLKNGVVALRSQLPLVYGKSVGYYITATKTTKIKGGVKVLLKSSAARTFEAEGL